MHNRLQMRTFTLLSSLLVLTVTAALAPAAAQAKTSRYAPYYALFDRGNAKIPGQDTRWVPQGLAYWPERDALVISYYDGDKQKNSRLAAIDRVSGRRLQLYELNGAGHVGALAISGRYLWIGDSRKLHRYKLSVLNATGALPRITASKSFKVKASSFATVEGDKLWLGDFDKAAHSSAWRYSVTARGNLKWDGSWIQAPPQAQGLAISGNMAIWSRSFGRHNDSLIDVGPLGGTTATRSILAPNMSQGLVVAGGELYVLYESGSGTYADADYRIKTVHHAPLAEVIGAGGA